MKPSLVLLFPFVLILCGPASASAQEALPKAQADAVAAIKKQVSDSKEVNLPGSWA